MARLILASRSIARRRMLENVGLSFESMPADIDEERYKISAAPEYIAQILADQKALYIARQNPDALVIGADSVLDVDKQLLSKAQNKQAALDKLKILRGKTHYLISAVSLVRGDDILWQYTDRANLTMHDLSDAELENYMIYAGDALTRSVGAYELEGRGAYLFEKIDGDFFTILGMPLLPLLATLREYGVVS